MTTGTPIISREGMNGYFLRTRCGSRARWWECPGLESIGLSGRGFSRKTTGYPDECQEAEESSVSFHLVWVKEPANH
jgi:hypothetical protein